MASAPQISAHSDIELLPGDVLLMLGHGEISKIIAWCSDADYSHAAIVVDGGDLIEAAPHGVRRKPVEERRHDSANYYFIDAFRPLTAAMQPLTDGDRDAVVRKADSLIETDYPLNSLATIGLLIAIRGKVPRSELARWLFRVVLDYLYDEDPLHQMCSEVVYRSLAECEIVPPRKLQPGIVTTEYQDTPFPDVDWYKLIEEIRHVIGRELAQQYFGDDALAERGELPRFPPTSEDAFDRALQRVRDRYGIGAPPDGNGKPVPHPNPKLVSTLDLAVSPTHTSLGRLLARKS